MKKCAISSEEIFRSNCPIESRKFFVLHPTLLKLHVLALLIESFPTPYRLCSCVEEKLSFRLNANASRSSSVKILVLAPEVSKAIYFSPYPLSFLNCVFELSLWRALKRRKAGGSASRKGCVSQHFCTFVAPGRCHSNVIYQCGLSKTGLSDKSS